MKKKRLVGIDIMATVFLLLAIGITISMGVNIHKSWSVKPIGSHSASYPILGMIAFFTVSNLLFKRDKRALPVIRWITIVFGFVGLVPLLMFFVPAVNRLLEPNDYWMLVISAVFMGLSAITYFYITRPKVKEQFK